jgi:hypothetical protein
MIGIRSNDTAGEEQGCFLDSPTSILTDTLLLTSEEAGGELPIDDLVISIEDWR